MKHALFDYGSGFPTLLRKEVKRFYKVAFQTVAAPVLTAVLYLLIFGHVLEGKVEMYGHLSYTAFLIPGLVMMSLLQNAFANNPVIPSPQIDPIIPAIPEDLEIPTDETRSPAVAAVFA